MIVCYDCMSRAMSMARERSACCAASEWRSVGEAAIRIAAGHDRHSEVAIALVKEMDRRVEDRELPPDLNETFSWTALLGLIAGLHPGDGPREEERASACLMQAEAAIEKLAGDYPGLHLDRARATLATALSEHRRHGAFSAGALFDALGAAVSAAARGTGKPEEEIWLQVNPVGIVWRGIQPTLRFHVAEEESETLDLPSLDGTESRPAP